MKTAIIILASLLYLSLCMLNYPLFKRWNNNELIDHPIFASFFWPFIWLIGIVSFIIEGIGKYSKK